MILHMGINLFSYVPYIFALLMGIFYSWDFFFLFMGVYSLLMLVNILVTASLIFTRVPEAYATREKSDTFWRLLYTLVSATCFTFFFV